MNCFNGWESIEVISGMGSKHRIKLDGLILRRMRFVEDLRGGCSTPAVFGMAAR